MKRLLYLLAFFIVMPLYGLETKGGSVNTSRDNTWTGTNTFTKMVTFSTSTSITGQAYMSSTSFNNGALTNINWSASDSGPGSGLGADTLDGSHGNEFAKLGVAGTFTYMQTFSTTVVINDLQVTTLSMDSRVLVEDNNGVDILEITGSSMTALASDFKVFTDSIQVNGKNMVVDNGYKVVITSPASYATGVGVAVSKEFKYAVTISTVRGRINGGTNLVSMVEWRARDSEHKAGTDIWSGDVTLTSTMTWLGGTASDFTIPANSTLYWVPTSHSGDVPYVEFYFDYDYDD